MIELECVELLLDPCSGVLESLDAAGVDCDSSPVHEAADGDPI
jgi:hypothetical protein